MEKKYYIITVGIISLLFCILFSSLFQHIVIFNLDDLNSTIDSYDFLYEENGRYVCNFLSRVIGVYLPKLFNIHPQNFINTGGAFFYEVIICLFSIIIASFYLIKKKNSYIFPFLIILPFSFFLQFLVNTSPCYSVIYSFQYGYVLASVLGLSFLTFLYNISINGIVPNQKYLIPFSLLGFCAGNSSQIVCYTIFISIVLISSYFLLFEKTKIKEIVSNKILYIPILCFFFGLFIMIVCPGFWNEVSWRHCESFTQLKEIFEPFCQTYYSNLILRFMNYFKIIFSLQVVLILVGIYKKKAFSELKICIFSLIPITSVLLYYFTLILGGPTFPSESLKFWIYEPFYAFFFESLLLAISFFLLGELSNLIKKVHYIFLIVFLYLLFNCFIVDSFETFKQNYQNKIQEYKIIRRNVYKLEKIYLYQIYKNEKVKSPNLLLDINIFENKQLNRYLLRVYNIKTDKIIYMPMDYETFKKKFAKDMIISKDEIEKLDFQQLYDNNFVLRKNNGEVKRNNTR